MPPGTPRATTPAHGPGDGAPEASDWGVAPWELCQGPLRALSNAPQAGGAARGSSLRPRRHSAQPKTTGELQAIIASVPVPQRPRDAAFAGPEGARDPPGPSAGVAAAVGGGAEPMDIDAASAASRTRVGGQPGATSPHSTPSVLRAPHAPAPAPALHPPLAQFSTPAPAPDSQCSGATCPVAVPSPSESAPRPPPHPLEIVVPAHGLAGPIAGTGPASPPLGTEDTLDAPVSASVAGSPSDFATGGWRASGGHGAAPPGGWRRGANARAADVLGPSAADTGLASAWPAERVLSRIAGAGPLDSGGLKWARPVMGTDVATEAVPYPERLGGPFRITAQASRAMQSSETAGASAFCHSAPVGDVGVPRDQLCGKSRPVVASSVLKRVAQQPRVEAVHRSLPPSLACSLPPVLPLFPPFHSPLHSPVSLTNARTRTQPSIPHTSSAERPQRSPGMQRTSGGRPDNASWRG